MKLESPTAIETTNDQRVNRIYKNLKALEYDLGCLNQNDFGIHFRVAIVLLQNAIKTIKPFF